VVPVAAVVAVAPDAPLSSSSPPPQDAVKMMAGMIGPKNLNLENFMTDSRKQTTHETGL
jgi:hypothetical protein